MKVHRNIQFLQKHHHSWHRCDMVNRKNEFFHHRRTEPHYSSIDTYSLCRHFHVRGSRVGPYQILLHYMLGKEGSLWSAIPPCSWLPRNLSDHRNRALNTCDTRRKCNFSSHTHQACRSNSLLRSRHAPLYLNHSLLPSKWPSSESSICILHSS